MTEPRPYPPGRKVRASELREGGHWELSKGELVWVGPTGGDGARGTIAGAEVLDTDPAVEAAGIDAGYAPDEETLRAPDVSVGNVPDAPGWVKGAPPLAVEYAGRGQDEAKLQEKIRDLLAAGTRWVWVARLVGARRVEVYDANVAMRILHPGQELAAPGVLQNAVPVDALFDRRVAHEVALRNLLQRKGYDGVDGVLAKGHAEGLGAARRQTVRDLCEVLGIALDAAREARLDATRGEELEALIAELKRSRAWPD
jgi:hypothetical protein